MKHAIKAQYWAFIAFNSLRYPAILILNNMYCFYSHIIELHHHHR
jgi:hypothetical protein